MIKQPKPRANKNPAVWPMVIADMNERNRIGTLKYKTPLQAGNGRKTLWDAYEEVLDLAVYLRTEIENRRIAARKKRRAALKRKLALCREPSGKSRRVTRRAS